MNVFAGGAFFSAILVMPMAYEDYKKRKRERKGKKKIVEFKALKGIWYNLKKLNKYYF